ncbi:MAG TPA: hypothetical protein VGW78_00255 [Candidatus Babeliales bacterium]|jgi:hypothetical protein|nr:hypothetical protein [Candidatus Babeliales bacterium]
MYKIHLFARKMVYFIIFISTHFCQGWTVKVINFADEKITLDIHSTQMYAGWNDRCNHWCPKGCKYWSPKDYWTGCLEKKGCEFIGKQIDPHSSYDFDYKDVNPICVAPCTKSVTITSPIQLSAESTITSCSNVIVIVRKDEFNKWRIEYHDWTAGIIKMLEERTQMPVGVRDIYDKFGDSPIQAVSVFRQPIMSGIKELMTIITKNELKQLNYDELYHTGFIIKCQDQLIKLERNYTVSSDIIKPGDTQELEQRDIVLPRIIHYNEFINKAMKNDPDFWKYNPINNNCQLFVLQCLERNTIKVSDDLRAFIYQDAKKVLANSPILKGIAITATSLANRLDKIIEEAGDITIQNGTPYTIRVKTRYAGESTLLKTCLPDDFLLESGKQKSISHGICLLEGIKVAASLKGADAIKAIPDEQLQQAADIFAENSFVGKGKASANFLIQSVEGKKFTIENQRLSTEQLQQLAATARANPALNLNVKEIAK